MSKSVNTTIRQSSLAKAVELTPDVKGCYCIGLKALNNVDKQKVNVTAPKLIGGSLDIDTSTKALYPTDNRWDYAVEYDGETYFIEVHAASTSDVSVMIGKIKWLKEWLKTKAPEINKIKAKKFPYHWIYTNKFCITKISKQYRAIAQLGLLPKATWQIK